MYGLPDEDALARIQAVSKPYRTDSDGPVVVTTDGSTYTLTTQKTGYEETGTASSHSESNASNSASSTTTEEPNTASLSPDSAESTVYLSDNKNDHFDFTMLKKVLVRRVRFERTNSYKTRPST
jgi:competence protein ComEC